MIGCLYLFSYELEEILLHVIEPSGTFKYPYDDVIYEPYQKRNASEDESPLNSTHTCYFILVQFSSYGQVQGAAHIIFSREIAHSDNPE